MNTDTPTHRGYYFPGGRPQNEARTSVGRSMDGMRQCVDWSLRKLGTEAGIPHSTLSLLRKGDRRLTDDHIEALAKAFRRGGLDGAATRLEEARERDEGAPRAC